MAAFEGLAVYSGVLLWAPPPNPPAAPTLWRKTGGGRRRTKPWTGSLMVSRGYWGGNVTEWLPSALTGAVAAQVSAALHQLAVMRDGATTHWPLGNWVFNHSICGRRFSRWISIRATRGVWARGDCRAASWGFSLAPRRVNESLTDENSHRWLCIRTHTLI